MKHHLTEALIICLLAIFLALVINGLRTDRLPLTETREPAQATDSQTGVRRITIEAAIAKFNQSSALFADARAAADFAAGHIAGAISLPARQPDQWLERVFASVDPQKTVITYCAGPQCGLGKELAMILTEAGFEQVFYLVDGWGQWTAHKMPTAKGE